MKPFILQILTRGETLYEGEIESLSSVNDTGKFDVLRRHANFISLIRDYLIVREQGGKSREIKIGSGILEVFGNRASAYLGVK